MWKMHTCFQFNAQLDSVVFLKRFLSVRDTEITEWLKGVEQFQWVPDLPDAARLLHGCFANILGKHAHTWHWSETSLDHHTWISFERHFPGDSALWSPVAPKEHVPDEGQLKAGGKRTCKVSKH